MFETSILFSQTHEEFFRLIGPLLYSNQAAQEASGLPSSMHRPPIDWIHFEGRTVPTTKENLTGLDGWLREKEWRHKVVLSVEVGKPGRQGEDVVRFADILTPILSDQACIRQLVPLADVVFFS